MFRVRSILLATTVIAGALQAGTADAGNGCASGTSSTTYSPDGNAASVIFDDFSATAGGDSGITRQKTTCNLGIKVSQPKGYSVYSVDYRGFVSLENGQTASINTKTGRIAKTGLLVSGPKADDIAFSERLGSANADQLALGVTLGVDGPVNGDPSGSLFLDTIDFSRIGFTTQAALQSSLDQLATQSQAVSLAFMDTANTLLSGDAKINGDSTLSAFGTAGTQSAGFTGRWNAGNGISLLGGMAYAASGDDAADVDPALLLAAGLRYVQPSASPFRVFGEAGLWGAPDLSLSFSRHYLDLDRIASAGDSSVSGAQIAGYGRIGLIYAPDDTMELSVSARWTHSWLSLDDYAETATDTNLFAATSGGQTSVTDTAALELALTQQATARIDYTLNGAVGRTFGSDDAFKADVAYAGTVRGKSETRDFVTLGGRLGYRLDDIWKLNGSVSMTAREGSETQVSVGTRIEARF